jgi:rare lipoprotein A
VKRVLRVALVGAAALIAGACAETSLVSHAVKTVMDEDDAQGHYKVGEPYQVYGRWYYPAEQPDYDSEGVASWYGPGFHGLRTANGEVFDQNALSAAHTTLPMPSFVRVTNLQNGRSLVLRVNDRGPFVDDRIIDVSRRAAQLLGFMNQGTAHVRVEAVPALEGEVVVASVEPAAAPPEPVEIIEVATAEPATQLPSAPSAGGTIFVQAGAFGDAVRAEDVRQRVAPVGDAMVAPIAVNGATLYRVRLGPYISREEASFVLSQVWSLGLTEARLATD